MKQQQIIFRRQIYTDCHIIIVQMGKEKKVFHLLRFIILSFFATLFTIFISAYYIFASVLSAILPNISVLSRQCRSCINKLMLFQDRSYLQLHKPLQVIINSIISLLMVLMITNYCDHFLNCIQFISHQTHQQFISFIFPNFKEIMVIYRPSFLYFIVVFVNYLGISAQLALAMDFIYIFNLPTILLYKGLARIYTLLLKQIMNRDPRTWLTSSNDGRAWIRSFLQKDGKTITFAMFVILLQCLIVIAFYYIWLALVITLLVTFLNMLENVRILSHKCSQILLILKGFEHPLQTNVCKTSKMEKIKKCLWQNGWVDVISWRIVKGIAMGEDIFIFGQNNKHKENKQQSYKSYSIFEIYRSFMLAATPYVYSQPKQKYINKVSQ